MKARFTHRHDDVMQPGDFIVITSLEGVPLKWIIYAIGFGWFDAVWWRWWHEVMCWNPCNDIELVIWNET